ncbi:VWA domain-containing protein [Thalassoroseus pseudoceratinae]|uniref:VWA domain-containing protein n=1 Tax=Thalassoroseus pseudoceratinae TaxID=2713176 RepID=UPI00197F2A4D|nr:VWA domain-containing protein [Thalassoroseus pseudoceratinae]
MTYSFDDPRITAYILGELHEPDLSVFKLELARSTELQAAVEETRETISLLGNVFDQEPEWRLDSSRREKIVAAAQPPVSGTRTDAPTSRQGSAPVLAVVTLVLLAGFAVLLNSEASPTPMETLAKLEPPQEVSTSTTTDSLDSLNDELIVEFVDQGNGPGDVSLFAQSTQPKDKTVNFSDSRMTTLSTVTAQQPKGVTSFSIQDAESKQGLGSPLSYGTVAETWEYRNRSNQNSYFSNLYGVPRQRGRVNQNLGRSDVRWGATTPQSNSGPAVTRFDQFGLGANVDGRRGGQAEEFERRKIQGPQIVHDFQQTLNRKLSVLDGTVRQKVEGFQEQVPRLNEGLADLDAATVGKAIELQRQRIPAAKKIRVLAAGEQPAAEQYEPIVENPFIEPAGQSALSTFSIDVDTASYANVRRFLNNGQLPPPNAVRIEELLNYFRYDYPQPADGQPFSVNTEVAPCPWQPQHRLVRFGLKGREILKEQRPATNLVFLIDTSGSMSSGNKLPLVKTGLEMLVKQLGEGDRIAIVTYAGNAGLALPSTPAEQQGDILEIIRKLESGGSTNGAAGITLAYQQAVQNFIEDGANRVILCTDGDFNVGVSSDSELVKVIEKKRESGVFLSVLGFGMGNLKDGKLEKLADKGNGFYGYIDSEREAKRVFERELAGTLYTIAKDVKIQVEFNPAKVGAYRLVGYENRMLAARDFHDDRKDAGEIGAGHSVTALYEIIPFDALPAVAAKVDDLKYQRTDRRPGENSKELCTLKLRYKAPDADKSDLDKFAVHDLGTEAVQPSPDFEWQASVAAFGMLLRNSGHKGQASWPLVSELSAGAVGDDPTGQREEFRKLVQAAATLTK